MRAARLPTTLRVRGAIPGTPAARALPRADEVLAGVNGRPLETPTLSAFCAVARGLSSGDRVVLNFAAPGRTDTRAVRLELA